MSKAIGRPEKEIKWDVLDGILQFGATLIDCSEILGHAEDTIQRRIKKDFKMTFSEYRHRKMARMRMKLLQKQYDVAINGNVTMLIWLGKQHLGQSDKTEIHESSQSFNLNYKLDEAA